MTHVRVHPEPMTILCAPYSSTETHFLLTVLSLNFKIFVIFGKLRQPVALVVTTTR